MLNVYLCKIGRADYSEAADCASEAILDHEFVAALVVRYEYSKKDERT